MASSSPPLQNPDAVVRDDGGEEVCLGDRVVVRGEDNGVLRYWGAVQFSAGLWAGVELDTPNGKHDGKVGGRRYFTTDEKRGVFVKKAMLCKALTLPAILPAGIERELQSQIKAMSNELQDRTEELHNVQEELNARNRELKLLRIDVAAFKEAAEKARGSENTFTLKRELEASRIAAAVAESARESSEHRESYARSEEARLSAELASALEAAASARKDLAVAQQQIAELRSDVAAANTRLQMQDTMTQRHQSKLTGLPSVELQRLQDELSRISASLRSESLRADMAESARATAQAEAEQTASVALIEREQLTSTVAQLKTQLARAEAQVLAQPKADPNTTRSLTTLLTDTQSQLASVREELIAKSRSLGVAEAAMAAARAETAILTAALERSHADGQQLQAQLLKFTTRVSTSPNRSDKEASGSAVHSPNDTSTANADLDLALQVATAMVGEIAEREAKLKAQLTFSERRVVQLEEDDKENQKDMEEMTEELANLQTSLARQREINSTLSKHVKQLLEVDADGI